jgi:large subunit ribosomal protein L17
MRHLKRGRKFHRKKGQRIALFKALFNNLVLREKIETTEAKAKEIKPRVEKLITLGKKQNLKSFRLLLSRMDKKAAEKIYFVLSPRYENRKGGYVRIIKSAKKRKKDGARMAVIEFV